MILPSAVSGNPALLAGWGLLAAGSAKSANANEVTPGVLGFLVIAGMGLLLFFLLRSMSKHLRRVRSVHEAGLEPGSKIEATAASGAKRGPGYQVGSGNAGDDRLGGGRVSGGAAPEEDGSPGA